MNGGALRLAGSHRLVTVLHRSDESYGGLRHCRRDCALPAARNPAASRGSAIRGRKPGVLRVAIGEEPKNLNPLLAGTTYEIFIDRLMFEPLLSADPRGNHGADACDERADASQRRHQR